MLFLCQRFLRAKIFVRRNVPNNKPFYAISPSPSHSSHFFLLLWNSNFEFETISLNKKHLTFPHSILWPKAEIEYIIRLGQVPTFIA